VAARILNLRIDRELHAALDAATKRAGAGRSEVAREALRRGLGLGARPDQEGRNRAYGRTMRALSGALESLPKVP
jgi:metal-responsive CopG/Arc/MetJ family transcriptional regulator